MRTSTSTTADLVANVYTIEMNYYNDTALGRDYMGVVGSNTVMYRFYAPERSAYNKRYLAKTNNNTPASDGQGTSFYTAFRPSGNIFYDFVID